MIFDAIVLAGGRSSRLGGEPKALLALDGRPLVARTIDAVADARRTVVVGEGFSVPDGVLATREEPAFAGPAAAIAAGLAALAFPQPDVAAAAEFVLVLACDMPGIAMAVPALLEGAGRAADGAIAVDSGGHPQYLAGIYRTASLAAAVERHGGLLVNLSVRALLAGLELEPTAVPSGSTSDVDTWADAARFGIAAPADHVHSEKETPMANQDDDEKMAALTEWSGRLSVELAVDGIDVDVDAVLALAGVVAHAVMRPAAPLTTFIVGYAAGVAAADGGLTPREAFERAAAAAAALARSDDR